MNGLEDIKAANNPREPRDLTGHQPQHICRALAQQCLDRAANSPRMTGKARDADAVEFYAGACAALVAVYGEGHPIVNAALAHFALIVVPRGMAGVRSILK